MSTHGRGVRWTNAAAAGVLLASAASGGAPQTALAQTAPRQTAEITFTTQRPARSTGFGLSIDYADPANPSGKPHAVADVTERLPAGARIDTSVPPRCAASDAELIVQGAAACPTAVVGTGELDLDTGAPGPLRIIANRIVFLNAKDELIFVVEPTTPGGVRVIARAAVGARSIRGAAPPLPGVPPPDPFAAIKRVRATLSAISRVRDGRRVAYITTPPACPSSRRWQSAVDFAYRDGIFQTVRSRAPCVRAAQRRNTRRRAAPRFTG